MTASDPSALFAAADHAWSSMSAYRGMERATDGLEGALGRWIVRFAGEEKDVIAVWCTWRQRTLEIEAEVMPAPEANHLEIYRYLLTRSPSLAPLFAVIGPESGLYLAGRLPVDQVSMGALDEYCGAAVRYVDELFPTVMAWGYPGLYRRRRH